MPLQSSLANRGRGICLLNAGGARGISQLTILSQLIHRLNYDDKDDLQDKPCTIFDMIGGVGSGGFIAILLVILRLTVEEALEEFTNLSVNVLDKHDIDAQARTAALRQYVDNLLVKYKVDQNHRLLDGDDRPNGCKLAIPVSYKRHAGSICVLRNYATRQEQTFNLTVAEAMMATLATPPLFTSIPILKDAATFEYIGADWTLSNPAQEIITEAHNAFGAEERVACLLSLGCGHPGVFGAPDSSSSADWSQFLEQLVMNAERTAQTLESQIGRLGIYHRLSVSNGLEGAIMKTKKDPGDIMTHTKVYLDDTRVSQQMDKCTETLRLREGAIPLEQLRYRGGPAVLPLRLPPLTKTFVMRKRPWEFVEKVLLGPRDPKDIDGPSILFVTGMGGCGKTQLMLRFMKEYKSRFTHQFVIDGSSEDRIRADVVRNMRALGTEHSQKSFDECLLFLSHPPSNVQLLLLYDNVDDPDIDLSSLLPGGDACVIAITSRNSLLGDLHPKSHLNLDVMSPEEATQLLLYEFDSSVPIPDQMKKDSLSLAEALGYLPIALQQARAYMLQTKCSAKEYLRRLLKNRENLLRKAVKHQTDMQSISTYAAFETSFGRLPRASQKLLWLLSYFHWRGFPLELVNVAALHEFSNYRQTWLEADDDFHVGKELLETTFIHDSEWDVAYLDEMVLSLQNYSLVTIVQGVDTLLLHMHPLAHDWVRTNIPEGEKHDYQCASIVLLALGGHDERTAATQYLASHVAHMAPIWDSLHVNNAMAFGHILYENGVYGGAVQLQERVAEELKRCPDTDNIEALNSLWNLGRTYLASGQLNEAQRLFEEVTERRKELLGERHLDTIKASQSLANTYRDLGRLKETRLLEEEVLRMRKDI
ncbi:hypothetical protein M408DRAFT_248878, partial [Serendipita vermifera MAFF 305830]